jgi:hypothetical protein
VRGNASQAPSLAAAYVRALVSGRSTSIREGTLLAVIAQVFVDESGSSKTFLMAGFIAGVETWEKFTVDWETVLSKYGVTQFHAFECESAKEPPYLGIDNDALRMELADVVLMHSDGPMRQFCFSISPASYKKTVLTHPLVRAHLSKSKYARKLGWSQPQGFMCHQVVMRILGLAHLELVKSVDFIFDWHDKYGPLLRRREPDMRAVMKYADPERYRIFGPIHVPLPDLRKYYVPLQAADLLAWHWRRALDEPDGSTRPVFIKLRNAGPEIMPFYMDEQSLVQEIAGGANLDKNIIAEIKALAAAERALAQQPKRKRRRN